MAAPREPRAFKAGPASLLSRDKRATPACP